MIYRIGDQRGGEFARLEGGLIVEVSGPRIKWAIGMSFGTLRKECHRRRIGLTTGSGRRLYRFEPPGIGYGD